MTDSINSPRLRVAALVDLPRSSRAGGHVKCWERLAKAASRSMHPLDLTVYFSGPDLTEELAPHVRLIQMPPVFSTARLRFLPYVPDHTDLAPRHARLAEALTGYDVIHTTDAFFAFAKTAEATGRKTGIPLVTSFHTDTPSYARIFTRQTIASLFGKGMVSNFLADTLNLPERQGRAMDRRLRAHLAACSAALATRAEDIALAESVLGPAHVQKLGIGVDKTLFSPTRADRAGMERAYGIPPGRIVFLFVGRVDIGKNIYTLIEAMERLKAKGLPVHLVTAGAGPAEGDVKNRLGDAASVCGYVPPEDLAALYASVDALALASEVETRSMAAVEGMASGCPIFIAAKSGVAALYHGTHAMQVVEGGAEAWAEAMYPFVQTPALRDAMRQAAVSYATTSLASWDDMIDDFYTTWSSVARAERKAA